jgi:hypothetical protein
MLSNYIVPLHESRMIDYDDVEGIDTDQSPADVSRFVVPFKCEVFLAGLAITETCAGDSTKPVVAFDKRPTLGSDSSRGDGDIANFVCGATAAGKVLYDLAGRGTVLYPGDEVVVQLVTAATGGSKAGHFIPLLLVKPIAEMPANLTDMVETA